ncbi:hydroxymethylglutaryl-CoA synthase [Bombardia bombarda]|uniref:Hydroxymethylglutaryl-CoA synthase n=1 Tax=Bombardia bombarda TaxID=252184 RepID=A0AA39WN62_9PEZI|nr:hydroxymethylglutaryl-CoA synthase [Bombardia bombarda]
MAYPENVGIKAMEIVFPSQCLDQTLFEKAQGASAGKYTIGLGQKLMNYCTDREDVCSMALTAVSSLLTKYNIDPNTIGRLEVGTESIIDKAKSVKTVLTQLFEPSGNTSLEGIDTINACYGATSALFNAVNWVESRMWDGRLAIVVASDIAAYDTPSARPTGGAGCVAMLIGPGAPLVLDPKVRGTFMTHAFDFYKPNFKAEYPLVDGHLSIRCYINALDECYNRLRESVKKTQPDVDDSTLIDTFDYMAFHTPNSKLVSKSYGRLAYNDFLHSKGAAKWTDLVPAGLRGLSYQDSLTSKELEKNFIVATKAKFDARIKPCIEAPSICGNMYTASTYCSLISLLSNIDLDAAAGKSIGVFSYGSGIAATLFTLKVVGDVKPMVQAIDFMARLSKRKVATPEEYEDACALREKAYGAKSYTPTGDVDSMFPGTYYLESIDDLYRRAYTVKK